MKMFNCSRPDRERNLIIRTSKSSTNGASFYTTIRPSAIVSGQVILQGLSAVDWITIVINIWHGGSHKKGNKESQTEEQEEQEEQEEHEEEIKKIK